MHFIVSYTFALKISSSCFTLNFLFLRFFRSHSPGYFIIFRWFSELVFMLNGLFWHCIILAVFSKPCIGGDAHWSYPISPCFTCSKWRIRFYIFCSNSHFVESGLVRNDGDGRCFWIIIILFSRSKKVSKKDSDLKNPRKILLFRRWNFRCIIFFLIIKIFIRNVVCILSCHIH